MRQQTLGDLSAGNTPSARHYPPPRPPAPHLLALGDQAGVHVSTGHQLDGRQVSEEGVLALQGHGNTCQL